MKIGILVHSKTGHTLEVANKLEKALICSDHQVDVLQIEASNDGETKVNSILLKSFPDISPYELVIVGAPVRGGSISPVLQAYLTQLPSLHGKVIMGYVTEAFPSPSMGGYQAIRNLSEILHAKNTDLVQSAVINWMFKGTRNKQISETINSFNAKI